MQILSSTVAALASGLTQVRSEIKQCRQRKTASANDRFVQVMEVNNFSQHLGFLSLIDIAPAFCRPSYIERASS